MEDVFRIVLNHRESGDINWKRVSPAEHAVSSSDLAHARIEDRERYSPC